MLGFWATSTILGGADAGGTIQGGEGLVELEHMAANGGIPFHQVGLKARIANVQGRLHTGNTAAHHHDIRVDMDLPGGQASHEN